MREIRTDILIQASKKAIWSALTDFEHFPEWNPFITRIRGTATLGDTVRFHAHVNGRLFKFAAKVRRCDEGKNLTWGAPDNPLLAALFAGEHYFTIEELSPEQCRFIHGERFSGVVAHAMWSQIRLAKQAYLAMNEALKQRVECPIQTIHD